MRNQNCFQVENLVAKYKNAANQSEAVVKEREHQKVTVGGFPVYEPRFELEAFELQLLGYYFLKVTQVSDPAVVEYWTRFAHCYQKGILTAEEEIYLLQNFELLVQYLLDCIDSWEILSLNHESVGEWASLVSILLKGTECKDIFLPATSFGQEVQGLKDVSVTIGAGFEFASINAFVNGFDLKKYDHSYENEGIKPWSDLAQQSFDAVIVDARFGYYLEINDFLMSSYNLVRNNGHLFVSISKAELIGKGTAGFRRMLKENQHLLEAFELNNGAVLLHIVKQKVPTISMFDVSNYQITSSNVHLGVALDAERFMREMYVASNFESAKYKKYLDADDLEVEAFFPAAYIGAQSGYELGSIVLVPDNYVETDQCEPTELVVRTHNLSHGFLNSEFKFSDLTSIDMTRARRYVRVSSPCVVMAASTSELAIGYCTEPGEVLVPADLLVLQTKSVLDAQFLAAYFAHDNHRQEVPRLVATVHSRLAVCEHWEKFVRISDAFQTEEEKASFVRRAFSQGIDERKKEDALQLKRFREDMRERKHALTQNLAAFDTVFRTLASCFEQQGGVLKKGDKISPVSDLTAGVAMKQLLEKLTVVRDRVDHLTEDQNWGVCESIEPQQFVEHFEQTHTGANYVFKHGWEPFETNKFRTDVIDKNTGKLMFHKGESVYMAWFPKMALTQVLENIVANAVSHGFVDPNRTDYAIRFSWTSDGLNLILDVANNGAPLLADVKGEQVLQYGFSTVLNKAGHGGIGGGQIADIMQSFGGSATVVSTPDKPFTVTYRLKMPLASLY